MSKIEKGALVLLRPHGRAKPAALGLRFDDGEGRFVYELTGPADDRTGPGEALDVTGWDEAAYEVDLMFSIEADLSASVSAAGIDDLRAGELAAGPTGAALAARFRPRGFGVHVRPVNLTSWEPIDEKDLDTVFKGWRFRLEVPGADPTYLAFQGEQ